MVLWSDSVCYAGGSIPVWRPRGPKEFQENNQCITFSFISLLFIDVQCSLSMIPLLFFLQRIMSVQYKIPDYVHISQDCRHLISRIFVASPSRVCATELCLRITINLFYEDKDNIMLLDIASFPFTVCVWIYWSYLGKIEVLWRFLFLACCSTNVF